MCLKEGTFSVKHDRLFDARALNMVRKREKDLSPGLKF